MKIISYKKKKNNLYEIILGNKEKINLYDDVILKYELLLEKNIKKDKLKEIIEYNSYLDCYYNALKYLNVKLRTEKEIRKKINNFDKKAIEYTIDRLIKEKYLNNELYIKSYINDEINFKIIGPQSILFSLKKLGFKEKEILNYLDSLDKDIWLEKIKKHISKKISSNRNLSGIILKQKIMQELITKGFYKEDITSILNDFEFIDNKDIYEKEYTKLKNKLSKKYSGEELEFRIKNSLFQKGFKD